MIDSVALAFGHDGTIDSDWDALVERLGTEHGQVQERHYGDRTKRYGYWKLGAFTLLRGRESGRAEVRASLPKVLGLQNDVVLSATATHEALRELVANVGEILETDLDLERARPLRLDYVIQWDVPSVAGVFRELRSAFNPPRKPRTEWVSSDESLGRSLYYGMGGKHVLSFYDKRAEMVAQTLLEASHGLPLEVLEMMHPLEREVEIRKAKREERDRIIKESEIDTLLRFEVQDRRPKVIRRIHENGYLPSEVMHELAGPIAPLQTIALRDFEQILAAEPQWQHRVMAAVGKWALAEHPELWPSIRKHTHRNTYSRLRSKVRQSAPRSWSPAIPPDAFGAEASVWASTDLRRLGLGDEGHLAA